MPNGISLNKPEWTNYHGFSSVTANRDVSWLSAGQISINVHVIVTKHISDCLDYLRPKMPRFKSKCQYRDLYLTNLHQIAQNIHTEVRMPLERSVSDANLHQTKPVETTFAHFKCRSSHVTNLILMSKILISFWFCTCMKSSTFEQGLSFQVLFILNSVFIHRR